MPGAYDDFTIATFYVGFGLGSQLTTAQTCCRLCFASIPRGSLRCAVLYKFHSVFCWLVKLGGVWVACLLVGGGLDRSLTSARNRNPMSTLLFLRALRDNSVISGLPCAIDVILGPGDATEIICSREAGSDSKALDPSVALTTTHSAQFPAKTQR